MLKRIVLFAAAGATLGTLVAALAIHSPSHSTALAAGSEGQVVYTTNCAGCHGATGMGAPNLAPPLVKNSYVKGDPKAVIKTVLHGMNGPIKVNGKPWGSGAMPPWKGVLSNAQIAAVITYIRAWNKAPAVTEKQVASVK